MESTAAYDAIKKWAASLRLNVKDAADPASRVRELSEAIATLRLSQLPAPPDPDFEAVRVLMLDYLESLVQSGMEKKLTALENQPYFGCHRTADSKPPESHGPLKKP